MINLRHHGILSAYQKSFTTFLRGVIALTLIFLAGEFHADARKTTLKFKGDSKELTDSLIRGSFQVASQCEDCNNGYRLDQVTFSGFDKPGRSSKESFFITNHTDRTLSGISLYIDYLTPDGKQLHKRWIRLNCHIPPGETRKADISSWDSQRAFHYIQSQDTRTSSPFTVIFDPVAYYLRF